MISIIAFLGGMIAVPALLAWAGHKLRSRSGVVRGLFWGGVIGYVVAMIAFFAAAFAPPVLWPDASLRQLVVYWGLLAGAGAGAAIGAVRARE